MSNSRYSGKPLLRLLECYVLNSINQLPVEQSSVLKGMEPKLAQLYGVKGSWDTIIATVMSFPVSMPELIKDSWRKNEKIAADARVALTPQQFAEMFVDQNFIS